MPSPREEQRPATATAATARASSPDEAPPLPLSQPQKKPLHHYQQHEHEYEAYSGGGGMHLPEPKKPRHPHHPHPHPRPHQHSQPQPHDHLHHADMSDISESESSDDDDDDSSSSSPSSSRHESDGAAAAAAASASASAMAMKAPPPPPLGSRASHTSAANTMLSTSGTAYDERGGGAATAHRITQSQQQQQQQQQHLSRAHPSFAARQAAQVRQQQQQHRPDSGSDRVPGMGAGGGSGSRRNFDDHGRANPRESQSTLSSNQHSTNLIRPSWGASTDESPVGSAHPPTPAGGDWLRLRPRANRHSSHSTAYAAHSHPHHSPHQSPIIQYPSLTLRAFNPKHIFFPQHFDQLNVGEGDGWVNIECSQHETFERPEFGGGGRGGGRGGGGHHQRGTVDPAEYAMHGEYGNVDNNMERIDESVGAAAADGGGDIQVEAHKNKAAAAAATAAAAAPIMEGDGGGGGGGDKSAAAEDAHAAHDGAIDNDALGGGGGAIIPGTVAPHPCTSASPAPDSVSAITNPLDYSEDLGVGDNGIADNDCFDRHGQRHYEQLYAQQQAEVAAAAAHHHQAQQQQRYYHAGGDPAYYAAAAAAAAHTQQAQHAMYPSQGQQQYPAAPPPPPPPLAGAHYSSSLPPTYELAAQQQGLYNPALSSHHVHHRTSVSSSAPTIQAHGHGNQQKQQQQQQQQQHQQQQQQQQQQVMFKIDDTAGHHVYYKEEEGGYVDVNADAAFRDEEGGCVLAHHHHPGLHPTMERLAHGDADADDNHDAVKVVRRRSSALSASTATAPDDDGNGNDNNNDEEVVDRMPDGHLSSGTGGAYHIASADSKYETYACRVDTSQGDRSAEIALFSCARPHMRSFHMAWFGFFVAFFTWFAIAPLLPEVQQSLKLTTEQVWNSSICSVAGTVVFRVVAGPICDKYGARWVMGATLFISGIPCMCTGLVQTSYGLCILRTVIGIAGSGFVTCQYWTSTMFIREVAGTANSLAAGWGNLGGGVTQVVMGSVLFPLFKVIYGETDTDEPADRAWRTACVVPGICSMIVAIFIVRYSDDCPKGNYRKRERLGLMPSVSAGAALASAARDLNTWLLIVQYACCFGVELTMSNAAVLYFTREFGLTTESAAAVASIFGWMNLFARGLGGFISDMMNASRGMRGRLLVQSFSLVMEGCFVVIFAYTKSLGGAIVTMIIFSLFVQTSEGAVYSVVPYVKPPVTGSVAGLIGAGGNVGGVVFAIFFRYFSNDRLAFTVMGLTAAASSLLTLFVSIRGHGGLFCGCRYKDDDDESKASLHSTRSENVPRGQMSQDFHSDITIVNRNDHEVTTTNLPSGTEYADNGSLGSPDLSLEKGSLELQPNMPNSPDGDPPATTPEQSVDAQYHRMISTMSVSSDGNLAASTPEQSFDVQEKTD